ncbi:GntR family transcriptional regulator [Paenibacillus agaridevorans]|uniref:GntR family transcriptional regulator n=1 Tax=Paenibacillus agaridevorans TaxID=171404 RepID=UPI001BE3EC93|nr:GntR family transcriptional regulator [Paenibacillus agaridevorans]
MLDDKLPVTLQYQLRSKMLEKIQSKIWAPGEQIASERELCDEYGVSRITVREVIKGLVQEGYLVRKQGKGTFVSLPKFEHELSSDYSLSKELEKSGLESSFQLISFKPVQPSVSLMRHLEVNEHESIHELIRLRHIGGEIFAWERSYTPSKFLEKATEEDLDREGLYMTIFHCSGLMAEEAEVEIEAANCPSDIAVQLQIKKNAAVMHLTRVTMAQEQIIEYCESFIISDKYKYKYRQKLRKKAVYEGALSESRSGE